MKKQSSVRKLGLPKGEREALIKSQVKDLLQNGHLKTTKSRAKVVAQHVDSLLGHAANNNVKCVEEYLVSKTLVSKVSSLNFENQKTGFVSMRTVKNRPGDNAELVLLELLVK